MSILWTPTQEPVRRAGGLFDHQIKMIRQQPRHPMVDFKNPLSVGLKVAATGSSILSNVVGGGKFTVSGTSPIGTGVGWYGEEAVFSGSVTVSDSRKPAPSNAFTVLFMGQVDLCTGFDHLTGFRNSADTSYRGCLCVNATGLLRGYFSDGTYITTASSVNSIVGKGGFIGLTRWEKGKFNRLDIFPVIGSSITEEHINGSVTNPTDFYAYPYLNEYCVRGYWNSGDYIHSRIALSAGWSRCLTDNEVSRLVANPWSIFL